MVDPLIEFATNRFDRTYSAHLCTHLTARVEGARLCGLHLQINDETCSADFKLRMACLLAVYVRISPHLHSDGQKVDFIVFVDFGPGMTLEKLTQCG